MHRVPSQRPVRRSCAACAFSHSGFVRRKSATAKALLRPPAFAASFHKGRTTGTSSSVSAGTSSPHRQQYRTSGIHPPSPNEQFALAGLQENFKTSLFKVMVGGQRL